MEETPRAIRLCVQLGKYIDTAVVDVDVQPEHVTVTVQVCMGVNIYCGLLSSSLQLSCA